MKHIIIFLLFFVLLASVSCDWLMQDSDKNRVDENGKVERADDSGEEPPGDGVPDY